MMSNAGCWKRQVAALSIVTSLLSCCATVGSETPVAIVCPPIVEYGREIQARAAQELTSLPEISAIFDMLSDYAVLRDQADECN